MALSITIVLVFSFVAAAFWPTTEATKPNNNHLLKTRNMKTTTNNYPAIICFFISLFIMGLVIAGNAQTVKQDAKGNYIAVSKPPAKDSVVNTGKTYTDTKGNSYPVYQGKKGGLYIIRISRTGTTYKQYLKL